MPQATLLQHEPPRFELLVGSVAFWQRAGQDIAAARRRVLVQAMTFEGDAAGQSVARAVADSSAADRRVLVDGPVDPGVDILRLRLRQRELLRQRLRLDAL